MMIPPVRRRRRHIVADGRVVELQSDISEGLHRTGGGARRVARDRGIDDLDRHRVAGSLSRRPRHCPAVQSAASRDIGAGHIECGVLRDLGPLDSHRPGAGARAAARCRSCPRGYRIGSHDVIVENDRIGNRDVGEGIRPDRRRRDRERRRLGCVAAEFAVGDGDGDGRYLGMSVTCREGRCISPECQRATRYVVPDPAARGTTSVASLSRNFELVMLSVCPGYWTWTLTPPPRGAVLDELTESSARLCSVKIAPPELSKRRRRSRG